jgi:hypothetical protein
LRGFHGSLLAFTRGAKVFPHLVRKLVVERTGVGPLILDPDILQILDNDVAFDLQFAGQFVDPYLSHACLFLSPLPSRKIRQAANLGVSLSKPRRSYFTLHLPV